MDVECYLKGGYGAEFYAVICIPKARYCYEESFEYDDKEDSWSFEVDIDVDNLDVGQKINELTLYIFTK